MTRHPWRVALVGFGRIAAGYAEDEVMAKYYPYAAHAQVLRDHPQLDWQVVIEPDPFARQVALSKWGVPTVVPSIDHLDDKASEIDVVVLATPPSARLGILQHFPALQAVLVEKPLGDDLSSTNAFLNECKTRNLLVQVNLWRRADRGLRELAAGKLTGLIGEPLAANCLYGNGLLNNGTHMIDMCRMLLGEIASFTLLKDGDWSYPGPIPGDANPTFCLNMLSGLIVFFSPIDFREYRENGMILWGRDGRLDILNEGLAVRHYPVVPNRATTDEFEVPNDLGSELESTVGDALYWMYDNLVQALNQKNPCLLYSPSSSALLSSRWVDNILSTVLSHPITA